MINKKEFERILKELDFELDIKTLEGCLNEAQASDLMQWLKKYKMNIRQLYRFRMDYGEYLLHAWELDESDPRYTEDDGITVYAKEDAPEQAFMLAEMNNAFSNFEDYLPNVEFHRSDLYG